MAAERHHELQQIERPLLRLAGEAHRLSVANQLESPEHANPQAKGPGRSCVRRRRQRVAVDQGKHECGFDALLQREIGEPCREIRAAAHEDELPACPILRQHRGETRGCAMRFARVDVSLDLQQLAPLLELPALEWWCESDRFVDGAHRAVPISDRGASLREPGQEVRHLQPRNTEVAGEHNRPLRVLRRCGALPEALLEHGAHVVEIGPLHAAGRR